MSAVSSVSLNATKVNFSACPSCKKTEGVAADTVGVAPILPQEPKASLAWPKKCWQWVQHFFSGLFDDLQLIFKKPKALWDKWMGKSKA